VTMTFRSLYVLFDRNVGVEREGAYFAYSLIGLLAYWLIGLLAYWQLTNELNKKRPRNES